MFKRRAHLAPPTLAIALLWLSVPASAQEALTENAALDRALAREGIAARDEAHRDEAAAAATAIGPLDNPELELARESAGGQSEWQLRVLQPIDLSGRRRALRRAALTEAEAAESDIAWRRVQLVAQTREAYVSCAAAGAERDVWQAYRGNLAEAMRVAEARAAEGDTALYDVRRTRVAMSAAEAELRLAEGERDATCATLAALTGIQNPQVAPSAMTSLRSGEPGGTRADLAAQEQRLLAATQRVSAARAARLPQVSIGTGIKRVADAAGADYGPMLAVGVTLPIFNGGSAAVAEVDARRRALEADLLIARRTAEAEQQAAATRALAARQAAVEAARARDDAARLGTIASTAYQAGEVGVVELVDAFDAQRDGELAVIAHARRAAEAAIHFDLVTGRTYP